MFAAAPRAWVAMAVRLPSIEGRKRASARRRSGGQRGFAFLFTLLLVALLGLGLVIVAELDSTLARRERELALLQSGHEFRQALARYARARPGVAAGAYPLRLDDLLLDPRGLKPVRHLRRLYLDPMTGQADWGLVRVGGRIVGVHSLSVAQPIRQDGFDDEDAGFKGAARYRDWVFLYPADRTLLPDGTPAPAASAALAASAAPAESAPLATFSPVPPPDAVKP